MRRSVAVSGGRSLVLASLLGAVAVAACGDRASRPLPLGESGLPTGTGGSIGAGVGGEGGDGSPGDAGIGGPSVAGPCSDIFADDLLPTYEMTIAPADWDALLNDFYSMQQNIAAGQNYHPYHPLAEFRYGNEVITNAMVRLKGWSSWWQAEPDPDPKMQFVIAFDAVDGKARFHGVKKIELDMPRIDNTYLRQRVALSYLRTLGLPAQCANNGRLVINGAYYGLYTNMERPDDMFTKRVFPEAPRGDLWDAALQLQTNTDTMGLPHPHIDAFWNATDTASLAAIADMDESLLEWAAEALLGDPDGYWVGHWNFYIYDHPTRGLLFVPHDLDATIDWIEPHVDPIFYWGSDTKDWSPPWQHYAAVIASNVWRDRYVAAVRQAYDVYATAQLPDMVDRFAAQIRDAASADPTRPFSFQDHLNEVATLRQAIVTRTDAVAAWLACRAAPAGAVDADGDGFAYCMDCNDSDPATHPGAAEICGDGRDQDCDGNDFDGCR